MRILQLLPAMEVGGVERGAAELSRLLCAGGAESIVLSRGGALANTLANHGAQHITFDCGSKNLLTAPARALQLRRLLRAHAPDIVHVHSRAPAWLLALAGSWKRVVSTFHGIYSAGRYSEQMIKTHAVICPSTAVRTHIRVQYKVPEEKLHLIHPGVDMDYFDPAKVDAARAQELRQQWKLPDGHRVFMIAGRPSRIKGHALFLQAFAELRRNHTLPQPVCALLLGVGKGRRAEELRAQAAQLGIAKSIHFAEVTSDMREAYANCDVLVSASTRPEAFGLTVAEALAMQRAAAAPAHGGALDIITDDSNGALFPPHHAAALADAMARAVHLPRDHLRASVANFTLEQMAAKTITLYRNLLSQETR